MYLYWLESESRYVHRQSDVPKGTSADRVDVPTDTAGLMAYLNNLIAERSKIVDFSQFRAVGEPLNCAVVETQQEADAVTATGAGVGIEAPEELFPDGDPVEAPAMPKVCMSASSVLSRIDSPGVPVDQVVETIGKAPMYALKRYSGAVAVRFQELANR